MNTKTKQIQTPTSFIYECIYIYIYIYIYRLHVECVHTIHIAAAIRSAERGEGDILIAIGYYWILLDIHSGSLAVLIC